MNKWYLYNFLYLSGNLFYYLYRFSYYFLHLFYFLLNNNTLSNNFLLYYLLLNGENLHNLLHNLRHLYNPLNSLYNRDRFLYNPFHYLILYLYMILDLSGIPVLNNWNYLLNDFLDLYYPWYLYDLLYYLLNYDRYFYYFLCNLLYWNNPLMN